MKIRNTYLSIATILLAVGCVVLFYMVTVSYPVVSKEVQERLLIKLDNQGILYHKEGDAVRFLKKDRAIILKMAQEAANEVMPLNRSFSPAPDEFEKILARLNSKGIKYEIREIDGINWIVLSPEYEGRVEEVMFDGI
jgi:hypothetical protein